MRILSIALDELLMQPDSVPAMRQRAYFVGHEARIMVLGVGKAEEVALGPNLIAERVGGRNKIHGLFRAVRRMRALSRGPRFDIVSSQDAIFTGWCAWVYARLAHVPFVIQLHGDYLENPLWIQGSFLKKILSKIGLALIRHADGVRCVSERLRQQVIGQFHVRADKTISLPICTDLQCFSAHGVRAHDGKVVVFVGRLIEEKSPTLFCDAVIPLMKEMPDLIVAMIGQGNMQDMLRQAFVDAGVGERVTFPGQLSLQDVSAWYRSAVCYVHTAAWEGWGMPMIESLACGCPVVTTNSGCAGEVVRDGENGFVVPIDDVNGLRERTRQLLNDPALRARLSSAGLEEAKRWDFAARAQDQVNFYQRVLQHRV